MAEELEEFGSLKARYIISIAQQEFDDGEGGVTQIFEGEIPDDEDDQVKEAAEVVEMALDAQEEGFESEAIDAVIEAYEVDEDDIEEEEDEDEETESEEEADEAEDEDEDSDEDSGDEDEEEAETAEVKPPWRGYDKRTLSELKKTLPTKDNETLAATYEYEVANKDRDGVKKLLERIAAERQEEDEAEEEETEHASDDPTNVRVRQGKKTMVIAAQNVDDMVKAGWEVDDDQDDIESAEAEDPDEDEEHEARTQANEEAEEEAPPKKKREKAAADDDEFDAEHLDLVQKVVKKIDKENLFVPDPLPEDIIELPFDLTDCTNTEIRKLHGAFNAYSSRAAYVLMIEEQCERACGYIMEEKMAAVINETEKIDPETKKPKTVTALEAEALQDDEVSLWKGRKQEHGSVVIGMRKERDMYDKTVTVLSREWTMRSEEFAQAGGLSNRSKKKS